MTYYSNMSSTINRAPSVRKSCFFFSTQPRGTPLLSFFFFLMIRRPPRSTRYETLFPYRRSSDLELKRQGAQIVSHGLEQQGRCLGLDREPELAGTARHPAGDPLGWQPLDRDGCHRLQQSCVRLLARALYQHQHGGGVWRREVADQLLVQAGGLLHLLDAAQDHGPRGGEQRRRVH